MNQMMKWEHNPLFDGYLYPSSDNYPVCPILKRQNLKVARITPFHLDDELMVPSDIGGADSGLIQSKGGYSVLL
jgi:hypothetical protein